MALQFFFTSSFPKIELRQKRLKDLLRIFFRDVEVNSIISFRVAKIIESLVDAHHTEILKTFIRYGYEEQLLDHLYDESVGLLVYFNTLINIKNKRHDFSIILDSPMPIKSPSIELNTCQEKTHLHHKQSVETTSHVIQEYSLSPRKHFFGHQFFSHHPEDEFKDYSKKKTGHSLNVSQNLDPEREHEKFLHEAYEYRIIVIRKLIERINVSTNEDTVMVGLAVLAKMFRSIHELFDFRHIVIQLFYQEDCLMRIYSVAKSAKSSSIFAKAIEVLVLLLELHNNIFSEKMCEDKRAKLCCKFLGTYVDIIEGLKDYLLEVDSQGRCNPRSRKRIRTTED
jgi:hypothetical protein